MHESYGYQVGWLHTAAPNGMDLNFSDRGEFVVHLYSQTSRLALQYRVIQLVGSWADLERRHDFDHRKRPNSSRNVVARKTRGSRCNMAVTFPMLSLKTFNTAATRAVKIPRAGQRKLA